MKFAIKKLGVIGKQRFDSPVTAEKHLHWLYGSNSYAIVVEVDE